MNVVKEIEKNLNINDEKDKLEEQLLKIISENKKNQTKCSHIGVNYEINNCKCLICRKNLTDKEYKKLEEINKIVYAQEYLKSSDMNFTDRFETMQIMFMGLCKQNYYKNEEECVRIFNQIIKDVLDNKKSEDTKKNNINNEYRKIIEERKNINKKIKLLEENRFVQDYIKIQEKNEDLFKIETELYKNMKLKKYSSCNHVLIKTKIESDNKEGRKYFNYGCIKCGLNNNILDFRTFKKEPLNSEEIIQYDFLTQNTFDGYHLDILCDIELATAIYTKIKESHPKINDKMAIKYFEIALDNIRNIEVTEERKENRAKRLSLDPNFNRWK